MYNVGVNTEPKIVIGTIGRGSLRDKQQDTVDVKQKAEKYGESEGDPNRRIRTTEGLRHKCF